MLAVIMTLSMGFSVFAIDDGDTVAFTTVNAHYLPIFSVDGGYTGTCCQLGNPFSDGGNASASKVSNTSKVAMVQYYYGYQQGWITNHSVYPGFESITYSSIYLDLTQISGMGTSAWEAEARSEDFNVNEITTALQLYNNLNVTVPSEFECYVCTPTNGSQKFIIYKYTPAPPKGYLTVKKSAARKNYNDPNATLAGAVYYVYTNQSCTTRAKDVDGNNISLTTNASGKTDAVAVAPGTYYVKEHSPSPGYTLDTTVKTVKVTADNTSSSPASVSSAEPKDTGYVSVRKITGNSDITG